jgi:hypothetical protein
MKVEIINKQNKKGLLIISNDGVRKNIRINYENGEKDSFTYSKTFNKEKILKDLANEYGILQSEIV